MFRRHLLFTASLGGEPGEMGYLLARDGGGLRSRVRLRDRLEVVQGKITLLASEVGKTYLEEGEGDLVTKRKVVHDLLVFGDGFLVLPHLEIGLADAELSVIGHGVLGKPRDELFDCLLYTSDAADERSSVDLGCRRIN